MVSPDDRITLPAPGYRTICSFVGTLREHNVVDDVAVGYVA